MAETQLTVLIVEDEQSFVDALSVGLGHEGFRIAVADDGEQALEMFDEVKPDLVLLDVMLPKLSGLDVCRELRRRSKVPIIMVTARSSEIDTVVGLEVGADDYVAKPYRLHELIARMHAVWRRSGGKSFLAAGVLNAGGIHLDENRHEVNVRGQLVQMPLKEFELLGYLLANAGHVISRDALIHRIWGEDYVGDTKTLDVHIKRLRSKIETDPGEPVLITTVRGLGYKFEGTKELAST